VVPAGGEDFVVVAEDPLGLAVERRLVELGLVRDGNSNAGERRQDQHQVNARQLQLALSDLSSNDAPRLLGTGLNEQKISRWSGFVYFLLYGPKVQQPNRGKPSLTRGGAKGTRTPNPLLAK
jgi:hypothetical protein